MFTRVANWVDQKGVRSVLAAIAILASVLLGPFAIILIAFGPREPLLFLLGLGGVAGLIGGGARIWRGATFFLLPRWARILLATLIAAGVAAAFLAVFALPDKVYWATVAPLAGITGLILLVGSIAGPQQGSNNSFKPKPLRSGKNMA